jgi:hypothetical protein
MVSDMHSTMVKGQEMNNSKNISVSGVRSLHYKIATHCDLVSNQVSAESKLLIGPPSYPRI